MPLEIVVRKGELFDERTSMFINIEKDRTLQLEHSLVSISKWESITTKPFLTQKFEKDPEALIEYIRCMTIDKNVPKELYYGITDKQKDEIRDYINAPMTATTFSKINGPKGPQQLVTSEVIYYWMISYNIPFECQKWHLNRLLTLVEVCNRKNAPQKKMSKREQMEWQHSINQARRQKYNTKG